MLVAATWIYTSRVDGLLLRSAHGLPTYGIEVLAVSDGEVTLPRGLRGGPGDLGPGVGDGLCPGGAGGGDLRGRGGAAPARGGGRPAPRPAGGPGRLRLRVSDPSAVSVEFENVIVEGSLGNYPAWATPGEDDTWVILVHDRDAYRREALRALPAIAAAGFPTLTITYRNDPGAPEGGGRYGLGDPEWEDLQAAVEYAVEEGAADVVLFGWGMGGTAAAMFLHESPQARLVAGLVFDAPLFDPGAVIDADAHQHNVPGLIVGWAKGLATLRWGVDWGALNQADRADDFEGARPALPRRRRRRRPGGDQRPLRRGTARPGAL